MVRQLRTRKAVKKDATSELSSEAIKNLAGYLDVLIQMDLSQKISNEIRSKDNGRRN